jgi:hypothetical protein
LIHFHFSRLMIGQILVRVEEEKDEKKGGEKGGGGGGGERLFLSYNFHSLNAQAIPHLPLNFLEITLMHFIHSSYLIPFPTL